MRRKRSNRSRSPGTLSGLPGRRAAGVCEEGGYRHQGDKGDSRGVGFTGVSRICVNPSLLASTRQLSFFTSAVAVSELDL